MDDVMDDALAQWLALRERADAAARSACLTDIIANAVGGDEPLDVLDLATGTGSNIRYLVERLGIGRQRWLAVDRSEELLAQLRTSMALWGASRGYDVAIDGHGCAIRGGRLDCEVTTRCLDLGSLDTQALFANRHLVTASALLDLVSDRWLQSLAARCREAGAAALFAITYDGCSSSSPPDPEDAMVLDRFNQHQRTDKGLGGPAAGPDAARHATRCFAAEGYQVQTERSDWTLDSADAELQRQLVEGWASAASEIAPAEAAAIADWRTRRLVHVHAGRSRIVVGHEDMAAWLPREP